MFRKLRKGDRGFTLVELLVTIAILGTLFGIVTLALNGLNASTTTNIAKAELDQVQTAVDIYLASVYPATTTLTAGGSTTAVLSSGDGPFTTYLRQLPTQFYYAWDTDGNVTQTVP